MFGHPGMAKYFINRDSFFSRYQDSLDQVFYFLAQMGGLRDYIKMIVLSKVYCIFLTLSMIYLSFYPSKGGAAVTKIYKMTPADQISHLSS